MRGTAQLGPTTTVGGVDWAEATDGASTMRRTLSQASVVKGGSMPSTTAVPVLAWKPTSHTISRRSYAETEWNLRPPSSPALPQLSAPDKRLVVTIPASPDSTLRKSPYGLDGEYFRLREEDADPAKPFDRTKNSSYVGVTQQPEMGVAGLLAGEKRQRKRQRQLAPAAVQGLSTALQTGRESQPRRWQRQHCSREEIAAGLRGKKS